MQQKIASFHLHRPETSALACLAVVSGILMPAAGMAQSQSQAGRTAVEEIHVTASKRGYDESLQSVPMSIQALPERIMEQAGVKDFADFARLAPSVSMAGSDTGTPQVSIRGVRTTAVPAQTTQENPLTSIYYDDLPVSMANFNPNLDLFDIQRIEVLRGPQGTLYGAGAMGGNIRFVTNKPNLTDLEAKFEGTIATTRRGGEVYDLKALVNVPVVDDKFALRITGTSHWDDGYVDNPYLGIKDFNDNDRKGARVAALFQPTEDLSITANFIYQDTNFKHGRTSLMAPPGEEPNLKNPETHLYGNIPFLDELLIYNLALEYDLGFATFYSSTSYFERNMTNTGSVQSLMELFFGLQLDAPNRSVWDNKDFVQEFRLTSAGDNRFNWVVGAFYSHRKMHMEQDFTIENAEDVFGFPTGGFGAPSDDILFYGNTTTKQKQYALFGEATYKITDKLHGTVGLRWFKWEQDFDLFFAGLFQGGAYPLVEHTSADKFTPKFALSYHANDDLMIYANAAKGYRLGGMNEPVPVDLCGPELAEVGLSEAPTTFAPDSLWSYEVGAKSQWFERRMTVNAAAFYVDWKDIQTLKRMPMCGFYFTENAGALESKGFELEVTAVPVTGLTLTVATTYTDATLSQDVPNLLAAKGDRTPYVPKWAVSAAAEYVHPITDTLDGYVRFDLQHVGLRYTEFNPALGIAMPSYEIANVHFGIDAESWAIAMFVKNIWDKRALTNADFASDVLTYTIERPRTIGVTLRARY
jgi:iron complex outermembrane receptor protein